MSESEGNGKEKRFRRFHERVSGAAGYTGKERLLFAPDFFDSLARVMAVPGDLVERSLAWSKYFAWGNHSEFAIRIEGDGKEIRLTQTDCAWDLAWLETGIRVEWLDAPPHIRDAELSRLGIKPIDKSLVSKAFTFNEKRGTILSSPSRDRRYSTARTIEPAVSPRTPLPVRVDASQEFHEFQEWFKVEHSREFHEREAARSIIKQVNKVEISLYKEWRNAKRTRQPSYKPLETENTTTTEVEVTPACETKAVVVTPPRGEVSGPSPNIAKEKSSLVGRVSSDTPGANDRPTRGETPSRGGEMPPQQHAWFKEWWASYWLPKSKKQAEEAFAVRVRTEDIYRKVMAATMAQRNEMLEREPRYRPYGSTWLNGERWKDEESPAARPPRGQQTDDYPELGTTA